MAADFKKIPINKLYDRGFPMGRMLYLSKSGYYRMFPDNIIVFNANIAMKSLNKIWCGDLDLTKDLEDLKQISTELSAPLYIFREMDYRFGTAELSLEDAITKCSYYYVIDRNGLKKIVNHDDE
jgi:hypothetical protein